MTLRYKYFTNDDEFTELKSENINNDLKYLSKKYQKYSREKNNDKESNYYTELLESKNYKIQELESVILSLKDEIEYMRYSLNDKIENIKMEHRKELFLLHKQQKEYIKNYIKN